MFAVDSAIVSYPRARMERPAAAFNNGVHLATWLAFVPFERGTSTYPAIQFARVSPTGEVLDRYVGVDPSALSPEPAGDPDDGLPTRVDEVGHVPGATPAGDPVRITRRAYPDGTRWVFTRATVRNIDGWYDRLEGKWVRGHLPQWWLQPWAKGLLRWQWASLAVCLLYTSPSPRD